MSEGVLVFDNHRVGKASLYEGLKRQFEAAGGIGDVRDFLRLGVSGSGFEKMSHEERKLFLELNGQAIAGESLVLSALSEAIFE